MKGLARVRVLLAIAIALVCLGLVGSAVYAESFSERFSVASIDESNWVVDNDSGYEVGITGGAFWIKGGPPGAGGPCDGLASYAFGNRYSFQINPVKLTPGPQLKDHQMGVVYLAQNEQRGGPLIAYGFIADPDAAGKVSLAWLNSNSAEWQVLKTGLDSGKWYNLGCVVIRDTEQLDLLFEGKTVETCDIAYGDEAPKLVLRSGSWDGENTADLEVQYKNITIE